MRFRYHEYLGRCASICLFAYVLAFAAVDPAHAITPSGVAVSVVPAAAAAGTTGRRTLQVDGDVFMGDKVQTGPGGEAQIQFKDATKLVVGPNSSMTIDAFVFDESNTARKVTMNATKGAFRFITGSSAKQAYTINTPTATIGVRGTRFDFTVAGNGEMTFAIFEGQARVCDRSGVCRDVRGGCEVVITPPGGGVQPANWGAPVAAKFPYVESQDSLLPAFRVNTAGCNGRSGARERATDSDLGRTNPRTRTSSPPQPDPPDHEHDPHCGYGGGETEGEGGRTLSTASTSSTFSSESRSFGGFGGAFGSRDGKGQKTGSSFGGSSRSGRSNGPNGK